MGSGDVASTSVETQDPPRTHDNDPDVRLVNPISSLLDLLVCEVRVGLGRVGESYERDPRRAARKRVLYSMFNLIERMDVDHRNDGWSVLGEVRPLLLSEEFILESERVSLDLRRDLQEELHQFVPLGRTARDERHALLGHVQIDHSECSRIRVHEGLLNLEKRLSEIPVSGQSASNDLRVEVVLGDERVSARRESHVCPDGALRVHVVSIHEARGGLQGTQRVPDGQARWPRLVSFVRGDLYSHISEGIMVLVAYSG